MAKTIFRVSDVGDMSVGIFPINATITIEDNYTHNTEYIEHLRQCIIDMYENSFGLSVLTEAEFQEVLRDEEKIFGGL